VKDDIFVDNDVFLMIDFINLKIKSVQSFRDVHKNNVYIYIFIRMRMRSCVMVGDRSFRRMPRADLETATSCRLFVTIRSVHGDTHSLYECLKQNPHLKS
jgi:hypothetical protein